MRCVHLLDTDGFAGTERHVLALVAGLRRCGVDAWIGCRGGTPLHDSAIAADISVVDLGPKPGLQMVAELRRQVRRLEIDALHAHNGRTQLMGAILHELTGVKLFATQHFLDPQYTTYRDPKRIAATLAHRWVNRRVSQFIAVSEAAREAMISREHIAPDRLTTIPNGIEPIPFPSADRVKALRSELHIPNGLPLVVTVARLSAEKGLGDLLAAAGLLAKTSPGANVHFVIVGEGPLLGTLMNQSRSSGVESQVHFTGFRSDATDVIATADVFVLPSPAEPFGLVLLEAMSLGKPVVACRSGGPIEIVSNEETGFLVSPNNPPAICKALQMLLDNPDLAAKFGEQGRDRFERMFTAKRMAADVVAMYERAMSAPGNTARSTALITTGGIES